MEPLINKVNCCVEKKLQETNKLRIVLEKSDWKDTLTKWKKYVQMW